MIRGHRLRLSAESARLFVARFSPTPMKSPTAEASFKLVQAVRALLQSDELMSGDFSDSTHALIEEVLETVGQVLG